MEFVFSNFPPLKTKYKNFADTFLMLLSKSSQLDIAVGYISTEAVITLQKILELNNSIKGLNLVIGMHYFDGFTKGQYNAVLGLNDFLTGNGLGEVRLITPFRFHGKIYSYSNNNGAFAGILGSNNLNSIMEGGHIYESAVLFEDISSASKMKEFIAQLMKSSSKNIAELEIKTFNRENEVLDGQDFVKKVTPTELVNVMNAKTDTSFEIPITTFEHASKSNINAFFGKGRIGKNGLVKPRHWYEVELIVPKEITTKPEYPKEEKGNSVFNVITDDGWSFKCKVSGDYNKNFRSEGDLKILGKWLKGRMENEDVLKGANPVTDETLKAYGRNTITFTKTTLPDTWLLDFEVKK